MTKRTNGLWLAVMALLLALPLSAAAQTEPTAEELAKQTQNPVASLISLPFQANWDFGLGERDAIGTVMNIQPVMPFGLTPDVNMILRVIVPLTSQPGSDESTRFNGFGDTLMTWFFSPVKTGKIIWGAGPALLLPTATDTSLGSEKFGIGPSIVALAQPGQWTVGMLWNHIWSTSGANDRDDVNSAYFQPFASYNLGDGLAVGASAEASGNYETDDWKVPLLFNVSKVTRLGRRPVSFVVAAGPDIASPPGDASWRFRFQANFLFPR